MSETLESIIDEITSSGWLVNNLFQLEFDRWRASLRNDNYCFEFGEGNTPQEALRKAITATQRTGFPIHDKRFPLGPKMLGLEDLGF